MTSRDVLNKIKQVSPPVSTAVSPVITPVENTTLVVIPNNHPAGLPAVSLTADAVAFPGDDPHAGVTPLEQDHPSTDFLVDSAVRASRLDRLAAEADNEYAAAAAFRIEKIKKIEEGQNLNRPVFDVIDRVCRTTETAGGGLTYLGAKMITASTTWVAAAAGVYVLPSFLNFLTAVVQRDPGPLLESTTAAATAAVQAVAAELIRANPPVPVELQRVAQEAVPAGVNFAIQLRDLVIGFAAGIEIRHVWRIVRNVRPR